MCFILLDSLILYFRIRLLCYLTTNSQEDKRARTEEVNWQLLGYRLANLGKFRLRSTNGVS